MENPRKNMSLKKYFVTQEEYKILRDSLDSNDKDKVLDIIFKAYLRGDF